MERQAMYGWLEDVKGCLRQTGLWRQALSSHLLGCLGPPSSANHTYKDIQDLECLSDWKERGDSYFGGFCFRPLSFPITMAPECQGDWKEGWVVGGVGDPPPYWWVWIVGCILLL